MTVDIVELYLSHREEIDEAAGDDQRPLLALYMSLFRKEAHRLLKEEKKTMVLEA